VQHKTGSIMPSTSMMQFKNLKLTRNLQTLHAGKMQYRYISLQ